MFSRSLTAAVRKAGITKRVTSHTFRHSFATHLLADGYDIRTVQELLGPSDVRTTMIDTHVLNRGGRGVRSPADGLVCAPDERKAETSYYAMTTEEIHEVVDAKRIAAENDLHVRLTILQPTGNTVTIL